MSFTLALAMLLSTVCFTGITEIFAAEIIPVYLDGDLISYASDDAQPQIYSNRTYVPIRKTAETLGLSLDWNSKTETMTFTRDGSTIAHTMRSTIVYVNGSAVTFDTPSINVKNRTLMPVRMLAESIGAQVEWDNAKRSVYITTDKPKVTEAKAASTIVAGGSTVKLTATASDATKVKFVDSEDNSVLDEVSEYQNNDDGSRTFETNYKPSNNTNDSILKTIYVYAGNESGYIESLEAAGKISMMVTNEKNTTDDDDNEDKDNDGYESNYMVKYTIEETTIEKGDYAVLKVTTTDDISRVKVTNSYTTTKAEASTYDEASNGNRVFNIKTKMNSRGNGELYIYLYVEEDETYEKVYETIDIKVTNDSDDDDDDDDDYGDLDIIDIELIDDVVYKGENAYVTVYTTTDIELVEIYNEDDDRVAKQNYHTTKLSNKIVWDLEFEVDHSDKQKYTVIGYDKDDEEAKDTFKLEGETYSKSDLVVLSVIQKTEDVEEGDSCKFEAKCTSQAEYIIVTDDRGNEIEKITSGSKSGSFKKFNFTIDIDDVDDYYYVYAYDSDDKKANRKFTAKVEEKEEVEITDVEVASSKIDEDDDIEVTVYTTTNVVKVWVEDEEGSRTSKKVTKPTKEKNNEYVWEIDFTPDDTGRLTFTIIAEDDDDNTDEWDIKVTVRD